MSTQLQAEQAIFDVARKITAGDARQAYLVQVCGGDAALTARVQTLLVAYEQTNGFLEPPHDGLKERYPTIIVQPPHGFLESPHAGLKGPPILELPAAERRGATIGRYKLLEQIGEGGMGVVYVAEQTEPVRRRVALKIIKPGMDTRQVISRFEAERQALAMMDCANIARVLDAGTTDAGRPYFVMELVRGMPITDYCDQAQLAVRQRLELFMTVCHAVQHAHQKGIIHRDLKPSNVMVTLQDGQPVVKVIDFGVAKAINQQLTERTIYTAFTEVIGTPLYMSPEQAELNGLDVDTRSDVYSLGVLLYELLTGQTPFDRDTVIKAGVDEIRRMIREDEPPTPSHRISTLAADAGTTVSQRRGIDPRQLSRMLKGELDWIVMKALEKDRNGRYESASAFAADVECYLDHEPVEAGPPSALYRFRKFARRRRGTLIAIAFVATSLLAGVGISLWQALEANKARQLAEHNLSAAREAVDDMYVQVAQNWLASTPGMTELQREFLRKAVTFYERTAQPQSADPEIQFEAATAYTRAAYLYDMMGESVQAVTSYNHAIEIFTSLMDQFPNEPSYYKPASHAYSRLGWQLNDMGHARESESAHLKSIAVCQRAVDRFGRTANSAYNVSIAIWNWSSPAAILRKYSAVEEKIGQAVALIEQTLPDAPNSDTRNAKLLAGLRVEAALARDAHGNGSTETLVLFRRLIHLEESRVAKGVAGHEIVLIKSLTEKYCIFGQLLTDVGNYGEADAVYRKAIDLLTPLSEQYPQLRQYPQMLARAHFGRGTHFADQQKADEATHEFSTVLKIRDRNAKQFPQVTEEAVEFAWFLATCPDPRFRNAQRAVELVERSVNSTVTNPDWWIVRGVSYLRASQYENAIEALEKSMELTSGGNAREWLWLSMAHQQLGDARAARGWYDKSMAWLDKNQPHNRELRRSADEARQLITP